MSRLLISEAPARGIHFIRDQYVERWWTSVIGPGAMLTARHLAFELDCAVDGSVLINEDTLAVQLGGLRADNMQRLFRRLAMFGFIYPETYGYSMPVFIGEVPDRFVSRWPESMILQHTLEINELRRGVQAPAVGPDEHWTAHGLAADRHP